MVHSSDEGTHSTEYPLNLRGMGKLNLLVDIPRIPYRPPAIDPLVDSDTIRMQPTPGTNVLFKKPYGMMALNAIPGEHLKCHWPVPHKLE